MMVRKVLALLTAAVTLVAAVPVMAGETAAADFKVGFITLHDENSTYDLNFINGAKKACEELGVPYEIKTNVPEGQECYDAAADLADAGCRMVFADSFGHEDFMIQAAKECPDAL